jgi:hypothetical protein
MIKKQGGKYVVLSEKTGRRFGTYATKAEAEKRLRQVEFFKHAKKGGPRRRPARRRAV